MLSLLTLRDYLKTQQRVSLQQLSQQFHEDILVISDMLQHFVRKGQLRQCELECSSKCQKCALKCTTVNMAVFEWVA